MKISEIYMIINNLKLTMLKYKYGLIMSWILVFPPLNISCQIIGSCFYADACYTSGNMTISFVFQCHSPSIIGFYGAFFVENRISICTEFMDGKLQNLFICKKTKLMYSMTHISEEFWITFANL